VSFVSVSFILSFCLSHIVRQSISASPNINRFNIFELFLRLLLTLGYAALLLSFKNN
jgi:hypothetical protein